MPSLRTGAVVLAAFAAAVRTSDMTEIAQIRVGLFVSGRAADGTACHVRLLPA